MGDMPKEMLAASPERGPVGKLKDAVARRRGLFDRLAGSPWAWAAAAVLALESQTGCATVVRGACYSTLEPNCSGIDYDTSVRQQTPEQLRPAVSEREAALAEGGRGDVRQSGVGGPPGGAWYGPRARIESLPPLGSPSVRSLPEGFYSPSVAKAVADRRIEAPPAFIDLRSLNYRASGETFSVVHAEVEEGAGPPQFAAARRSTFLRGLAYVAPFTEFDQGVNVEWHGTKRPSEKETVVTCRVTVSAEPAQLRQDAPVLRGQSLEHSILTDQLKLEGVKIVFSSEKSVAYPDRLAQAASLMWLDLPPQFFDLKAKRDAAAWKAKEVSSKTDVLGKECLVKRAGDDASKRKCAELDRLDKEFVELEAEIGRLDAQMAPLARAIQGAKTKGMLDLSALLMPHVGPGNGLKFFVRFDWAGQKLQVIAVLDNPLPASGK